MYLSSIIFQDTFYLSLT